MNSESAPENPRKQAGPPSSRYGPEWSLGLFLAALASLAIWGPLYLIVDDWWANACWYPLATVFLAGAALVSIVWLTCAIAEGLGKSKGGG